MKQYEFTDATRILDNGETVYRIRTTKDISWLGVKKGDLGGWMSKDATLGEDCWVFGESVLGGYAQLLGNSYTSFNAQVLDHAVVSLVSRVRGDAVVSGHARVHHMSVITDSAKVGDNAFVSYVSKVAHESCVRGNAQVLGKSHVYDNSLVMDDAVLEKAMTTGDTLVAGSAWIFDTSVKNYLALNDEVRTTAYDGPSLRSTRKFINTLRRTYQ